MRDLAKLLADYVDNKLDPETEIEIDGLILLYVDGELDSEEPPRSRPLMEANPAVAASISHSVSSGEDRPGTTGACRRHVRDAARSRA